MTYVEANGVVVFRNDHEMPQVTVSEYDPSIVNKTFTKIVTKDKDGLDYIVVVERYAMPETDQEQKELEEANKMGFYKVKK